MNTNIENKLSVLRDIAIAKSIISDPSSMIEDLKVIYKRSESKAERAFLVNLLPEIYKANYENDYVKQIAIFENEEYEGSSEDNAVSLKTKNNIDGIIFLDINSSVGKYRPDIILVSADKKIIFEIDGFAYHNTQEQLTKDKQRERDLSLMGYKVYRFSGTEIYRNAQKIALEAIEIIKKEMF